MKKKILLICIALSTLAQGCILMQAGAPPELTAEQKLYMEIMTAFDNRAFESCMTLSQQFLSQYSKSPGRDAVMIRMGEASEGLLKQRYYEQIAEGAAETEVRDSFLSAFGRFDCWETRDGMLAYNKQAFRQLLDENPDSNYADEALYNLIFWARDYNKDPQRINEEIAALENVITQYPTTSLRPKILFKMGYRYHLLYELYQYSPDPDVRSDVKAQESRDHAEYSYKLCLSAATGGEYAKRSLEYLEILKRGDRLSGKGE